MESQGSLSEGGRKVEVRKRRHDNGSRDRVMHVEGGRRDQQPGNAGGLRKTAEAT